MRELRPSDERAVIKFAVVLPVDHAPRRNDVPAIGANINAFGNVPRRVLERAAIALEVEMEAARRRLDNRIGREGFEAFGERLEPGIREGLLDAIGVRDPIDINHHQAATRCDSDVRAWVLAPPLGHLLKVFRGVLAAVLGERRLLVWNERKNTVAEVDEREGAHSQGG